MASAHIYTLSTPADVTVAAGPKTVLQLASPSTRWVWVKEAVIGFKSVTATDVPLLIQLIVQSTAGTSTPIAAGVNLAPIVQGQPAALSTGNYNASVEPTSTNIVGGPWEMTPVGGLFVYQIPIGDEFMLTASSFLGMVVTTGQSEVCRAYFKFNE